MPASLKSTYGAEFYAEQAIGSLRSARIVAALVAELVRPNSVVDVGCGMGGWLRAFGENGARELNGIDGDHVDRSKLLFDPSRFSPVDLSQPFRIDGRYDLAICLEVAEHIPHEYSQSLADALCAAAPVILFSAALPGQRGTGHINERWPEYWRERFQARGFRICDVIRPRVRNDQRVVWWYRQNMVIYASEASLAAHPVLRTDSEVSEIEWVHVNMLRSASVRNLLCHLRSALVDALTRRFSHNRELSSERRRADKTKRPNE
jgi:SAM-dependent methyltransferase